MFFAKDYIIYYRPKNICVISVELLYSTQPSAMTSTEGNCNLKAGICDSRAKERSELIFWPNTCILVTRLLRTAGNLEQQFKNIRFLDKYEYSMY